MTPTETLHAIAAWPAVAPMVEEVRQALTQLRWHQALRRRIPEAAAESRVRGARASAELDGARTDADTVRRMLVGAEVDVRPAGDPVGTVVRAAVQATAEAEHVARLLRRAPTQALSRLHVAAGTPLCAPEEVGRPRPAGSTVLELTDLGEPPPAEQVVARLAGVTAMLADPAAPAVVVGAMVHAEIATVRPFVRGNGLVARALERAYVLESGLDPTGVAVPEVGHGHAGHAAYVGALAAYGTGSREGVELWLAHWGKALLAAAEEGRRIADAVLAGRLDR